MPRVSVYSRVPRRGADEVLREVADFARWPALSDSVSSVRVESDPDGSTSFWGVVFRDGLMTWSQRDVLEPAAGRARFDLIEGDPLVWHGAWTASATGEDAELRLEAEFDLGMPSLSEVLDPMAVEALEEAIESVLHGLFGEGVEVAFARGEPANTSVETGGAT